MGLIRTVYEDSVNNNIKFDSSKFDFSYDSTDLFPAETAVDFAQILTETGRAFSVFRDDTIKTTMGKVETITREYLGVTAVLQDLTRKDRQLEDMGTLDAGDMKGFFKDEYTVTSAGISITHIIKEGDIFRDTNDNKIWKIQKILGERHISNQMVFKAVLLKNIDLGPTIA